MRRMRTRLLFWSECGKWVSRAGGQGTLGGTRTEESDGQPCVARRDLRVPLAPCRSRPSFRCSSLRSLTGSSLTYRIRSSSMSQ